MGRNLDPRFTTGHGLLVKPATPVCDITCGHGGECHCRGRGKKGTRETTHTASPSEKKTQHNTGVGLHFCQFHLRVSDTRGGTLHLRARTLLTFLLNRRPERLTQSRASLGPLRPATTTLPSEGHQNVLVNAAFVLQLAGWGGGGVVCLYNTNNSQRWAGREQGGARRWRWCWEVGGVQRGRGTPACATFGVNKVWKSAWRDRKCYWTYHKLLFIHSFHRESRMCHMHSKGGWTGAEPGAKLWRSQSSDALEVFATFKNRCGVKGPLLKHCFQILQRYRVHSLPLF